jgi:Ricin-type beta-trefoil lectin domain-like
MSKRTVAVLSMLVVTMTTAIAVFSAAPAQAVVTWTPDFIRARYNGKCLDADSTRSGANGTKIQLWDCIPTASNQQWYFVHVHTSGSGRRFYNVRSRAYSKCLDADVSQGPIQDGTKVQLWDCIQGASNQWWEFSENFEGDFYLRPYVDASRVLDADISHGSVNGMKIQMWQCCANGNKEFYSPIL